MKPRGIDDIETLEKTLAIGEPKERAMRLELIDALCEEQMYGLLQKDKYFEWRYDMKLNKANELLNSKLKQLSDLLIKAGIVYPFPFKGYIIASQNSEIVGIMMLKWLNQKRSKVKRDLSAASKYGFLNVFRLILGLQILDSKPKNGVCYIEYLAVKPTERGKGLGTQLINYGKEFAIQNGFNEYSLDVVSSNLAAQRLYKRVGFKIMKRERSLISNLLTGIEEWFYMSQTLI